MAINILCNFGKLLERVSFPLFFLRKKICLVNCWDLTIRDIFVVEILYLLRRSSTM